MTPALGKVVSRLERSKSIMALGVIALLAELGYATLNQSALQPYVAYELGLGAKWVSWTLAVFLLVEALFRPIMGAIGDRIGRKPLLIAGPIASCVSALLIVRMTDPGAILVVRVLDGFGAAAIWPTAFALVGDTVESENRSLAMSVLNVTYMIGIALGPLLGGAVNDLTGSERAAFYPIAILFALTTLVALLALPKSRPHKREDGEQEYHLSDLAASLRAIPHMLAMVFLAFCAVGLLIPIVKLYAMDDLKLTETGYGVLLLPAAAVLAALAIPLGRLGDGWGRTQAVRLGVSVAAAAMWLVASTAYLPALALGGSLLGVGFLIAMPAWLALISELAPTATRGRIMGAVGMSQGLGAITGSVLGGYLYDGSLSLSGAAPHVAPFALSAALLTLTAFLTFAFLRRKAPQGGA